VGGKAWGEFVSGGSPDPALQRLAVEIFDAKLRHGFTLQSVWRPWELNVRSYYLSRVSAMLHHDYCLLPSLFHCLNERWGPHTVDRFASVDTCQPLAAHNSGRFCSQFFHPASAWVDAFSLPWHGETSWLFPPVPYIAMPVAHICASRAAGTLVAQFAAWAPWLSALRRGLNWTPWVKRVVCLGSLRACLRITPGAHALFRGCELIAVRLDCRFPPPPLCST
jgi:hypothetical protein